MTAAFDLHRPGTVAEAIALLQRFGDDAVVMARGTSVILLMKQGLLRPANVVSLEAIDPLRGIRRSDDGGLEIGALTTHREVERSPLVRGYSAALAEAFGHVATVRIREQGTIGGNLAHADPAQDPPPMLLALGATLRITGPGGERETPLEGFFVDVFETTLGPGEIISSVRLPAPPRGLRAAYVKFLPRTADDYATVGVAAALALDEAGTCRSARIALGAAGPTVLRARRAEATLVGSPFTEDLIRDAAALVPDEVDPIADARGSAAYKREMARVWTERALRSLVA